MLLAEGVVQKVAVIDLDVHQGDGTAVCLKVGLSSESVSCGCEDQMALLCEWSEQTSVDYIVLRSADCVHHHHPQDEPRAPTLSVHCQSNFPTRKATSTLDVGLPDKTDDKAYMTMLSEVVPGVLQVCFVLVMCVYVCIARIWSEYSHKHVSILTSYPYTQSQAGLEAGPGALRCRRGCARPGWARQAVSH